MRSIMADELVTFDNFDEARYLESNPDVADVVRAGHLASGRQHFEYFGRHEQRCARTASGLEPLRRAKMARIMPFLRLEMPHVRRGDKFDFLTPALRREAAIIDTQNVSGHPYSDPVRAMIHRHADGVVLDCGSGKRPVYYDNVLNYEIVDYNSTDVIGIGEKLPFRDGTFDAVISVAVLEHVRNPFACAAEMVRVLKPSGELTCEVPFLQPLHGFPHHYYNMTSQGLRALFERSLVIDDHTVLASGSPVWSLTWIVRRWAECLDEASREEFLSLSLRDLLRPAQDYVQHTWVTGLSADANMELASTTLLRAHKPVSG
jgi:SAM-dependent methyltransferase